MLLSVVVVVVIIICGSSSVMTKQIASKKQNNSKGLKKTNLNTVQSQKINIMECGAQYDVQ